MPRNYPDQYKPRTYSCYTAASDAPVVLPPGPASPPAYVLGIMPSGFTLSRVTRTAWSLAGTLGLYQIRLIQIASFGAGGIFTPATRRIAIRPSGGVSYRGPAVTAVVAPGSPIFAAWNPSGFVQNAEGAEQESVLQNPVELQAGRGLALEVTTLVAGDGSISGYFDWEEFH